MPSMVLLLVVAHTNGSSSRAAHARPPPPAAVLGQSLIFQEGRANRHPQSSKYRSVLVRLWVQGPSSTVNAG